MIALVINIDNVNTIVNINIIYPLIFTFRYVRNITTNLASLIARV